MSIPVSVQAAAASVLQSIPGSFLVHLGTYKGREAYLVDTEEEMELGLPCVFLAGDKSVEMASDRVALSVISLLGEDA